MSKVGGKRKKRMGASGGEGWGVATRGSRWDEGFNGKGLGGRPQGVAYGGIGNRCQGDGATAKWSSSCDLGDT